MGLGIASPVGQNIKNARTSHRWTMTQLANEVGVPLRTVQRWENENVMPSWENVLCLAEVLNVKPEYFFKDRRKEIVSA